MRDGIDSEGEGEGEGEEAFLSVLDLLWDEADEEDKED